MKKNIFFLVDVNSAYLSWEAAYRLQNGEKIDYRKIPSIIGGNPESRKGIVLAKSYPAKKFGIQTGETLKSALKKCETLKILPPVYTRYMKASKAMMKILNEYTPYIEQFSIDECFLQFKLNKYNDFYPERVAYEIKNRIKKELGFTVNVGISTNKLLSKMASDLKKPDQVHTLYKNEIKEKMWPLPIRDLFMVGKSTEKKLKNMGIYTIGELAKMDLSILKYALKSHGKLIWDYANGRENSEISLAFKNECKSIGNSTTIPYDITDKETAFLYILSLTEMVSMRLRYYDLMTQCVTIAIKSSELKRWTHQKKLSYQTDLTNDIYKEGKKLFCEMWNGEKIRHIGVRVTKLIPKNQKQLSIWDNKNASSLEKLDQTVDELREKYGKSIIKRSSFLHSKVSHITGGVEDDYPMMKSLL